MSDDFDFLFNDSTSHKLDLSEVSLEDLEKELALRDLKPHPVSISKAKAKAKGPSPVPFPRPATRPEMQMREAWEQFDLKFLEGMLCPCCSNKVQLHARKIYAAVAIFLLWLVSSYRKNPTWHHVSTAPQIQNRRGGGDKDKLKLFGLIEEKPNLEDPTKRSSGYSRPTPKGIQFANGEITIPHTAWTYNNVPLLYSEEQVTIHDCLGKKYDFREVMNKFGA